MKAYSLDLRQKIVETYKAGGITQRDLAGRFCVSLFFIVKLLRLERTGQRLEAKRRGGTVKPKLSAEIRQFLRREIAAQNDSTLQELAERVQTQFGVVASRSTVCRACRTMQLRRKKRRPSPPKP